jgi:hypothetical protein
MKRCLVLSAMIILTWGASVSAAEMRVQRLVVCTGVEEREPVGVAESFPAGSEGVYAFVDLADVDCNCTVSFVWSRNGKEIRTIIVPVSMETRWRSWARKNVADQPGDWSVEVRDASNKPLMSTMFRVE